MNREQLISLFKQHRSGELRPADFISQGMSASLPLLTDVMFNFVNAQGGQIKCIAEKVAEKRGLDLEDLMAPHYVAFHYIYDFVMQLQAYKNVLERNPQTNLELNAAELINSYMNYYQKAEKLKADLAA